MNEIEKFFARSTIDDFRELFPVEMAKFASEHFKKDEYAFVARDNRKLVGAMYFSVEGGVGQLAAIQVEKGLGILEREKVRTRLLRTFTDACKDNNCHLAFIWIPYQCREAIAVYLKLGFEKLFTAKNFWYKNDFILLVKEF